MTVKASLFKKINITLYNSSQSLEFFYEECIIPTVKPDRHTRKKQSYKSISLTNRDEDKINKIPANWSWRKSSVVKSSSCLPAPAETPVLGDLRPSPGFHKHCTHVVHIYTLTQARHSEENKINLTLKNTCVVVRM